MIGPQKCLQHLANMPATNRCTFWQSNGPARTLDTKICDTDAYTVYWVVRKLQEGSGNVPVTSPPELHTILPAKFNRFFIYGWSSNYVRVFWPETVSRDHGAVRRSLFQYYSTISARSLNIITRHPSWVTIMAPSRILKSCALKIGWNYGIVLAKINCRSTALPNTIFFYHISAFKRQPNRRAFST